MGITRSAALSIDWHWVTRWTKTLSKFTAVQLLVQLVNALTGFMLIRMMNKQEYGWFTLASAGMAIAFLMADCGMSHAIPAIGGSYWNDRARFSSLINTALGFRPLLLLSSCLLSVPVMFWIMRGSGMGKQALIVQCLLLVAMAWPASSMTILNCTNRMHTRIPEMQRLDLAGAVVRAIWCGGAALVHLNAVSAIAGGLVAQVVQWLMVLNQTCPLVEETSAVDDGCRTALKEKLLHLSPLFVFYSLQGQLGTFLISLSAPTDRVADLGALTRLSVLFALLGAPLVSLVGPAFSRAPNLKSLKSIFLRVCGLYFLLSLLIALGCGLLPKQVLWILGSRYSHLGRELLWYAVLSGGSGLNSILWALCTLRGWTRFAWLNVPAMIAAQVAGVFWLDISNVMGVIWFNALTTLASMAAGLWIARVESRRAKALEEARESMPNLIAQ